MVDRSRSRPVIDAASSERPAPRVLSPEAQRALAEAAQRRRDETEQTRAAERNGRGGLEPVRFGDWEVKGLATDF